MPEDQSRLGRVGVWTRQLRNADRGVVVRCATTIDALGYGAMWTPELPGDDTLGNLRAALQATENAVVATGILNIWLHEPADIAAWAAGARQDFPGRVLLGLGASHESMMDANGVAHGRPLAGMTAFLDGLEQAAAPVPRAELALAALGPKMTALAAARTSGAHPYLVTVDHVRWARESMGPLALLAPEIKVVCDPDPVSARATARRALGRYVGLVNYTKNLERWGLTPRDFADGGSDRLVDAVTAWGSPTDIAARVQELLDAGADHVCINVVDDRDVDALARTWSELAPVLLPEPGVAR